MKLIKPLSNEPCSLCGRWDNGPVGVDMVIVKNGKILLIKRKKDPYTNLYDLPEGVDPNADGYAVPGGYFDYSRGQTLEQAIVREVKEETGLDVAVTQMIGVWSGPEQFRKKIGIAFLGMVVAGTEVANDAEISNICWCDPHDLPKGILSDHMAIIQKAIPLITV